MNIDIERLRSDLIDFFGTAASIFPVAIMDAFEVQNADYDKLIKIALMNGFDLNKYTVDNYVRNLFRKY